MQILQDTRILSDSVEPEQFPMQFCLDGRDASVGRDRRVVWKFGGTSVGDPARLRAVAERLVAARREGLQVVAVLSAMGSSTDDLARLAHEVSPEPQPRELDALLSVGESISCALAAIAVHELGERAVSLTGLQAGMLTDESHGNARLRRIIPERIVEALDQGVIVLVAGFQGVSAKGDVTTLGRGGSDVSAIALALALRVPECDIFTDVPGVFTADPRVVPDARKLTSVSHDEMLHLADAGARVLQTRAVELAATHDVDIHVRSALTGEPGTRVRRGQPMGEEERIVGVAHFGHDPLYTVTDISPATISAALAQRGVPTGPLIRGDGKVRLAAPGADSGQVIAALAAVGAGVAVQDELGSVSVVSANITDQSALTATIVSSLEQSGIVAHLVTSTPGRVWCHIPAADVGRAARALHEVFHLNIAAESSLAGSGPIAGRSRVA